MKKIVLTGFVVLFGLIANAQMFKKGDVVEINKNLSSEITWLNGKIVEVKGDEKAYVVRGTDNKLYNVPFAKEEGWIRKPVQALNASMATVTTNSCGSTEELVKQKIKSEFETDFSEYDTVVVTYNTLTPQKSYKNTDASFGKVDTDIHPYDVDITVRLVSVYKDGSQKKINWNFKRKYLLFQSKAGTCEITLAEKEENLISHI